MSKSTAYIKMNCSDDFGNCESSIYKMIAWVFCRAEQGSDEDEALPLPTVRQRFSAGAVQPDSNYSQL